ncbi:MAG TPA: phage tail sheath C-terminal domain-containing protein [Terriglobia bacterium]|nr:phage tail sheath C-terminal domain-containing protein [Terriglobia bacterium]
MPINPTSPGVYIEELPSGPHTISGVATSIACLIGWAPKGPTTNAQRVLSWADFNNHFGGLDSRSLLGYAVNQFFANGGTQAYIVRLVDTTDTPKAAAATASLAPITVNALNMGGWGNNYSTAIKNPSPATGRFQLQVLYTPSGSPTPPPVLVESFENLTTISPDPQGRNVVDVVNNGSNYITVAAPSGTTTLPSDTDSTPVALSGGNDGNVLRPSTDPTAGNAFDIAVASTTALLDRIDLFNLLCVPGECVTSTLTTLEGYCEKRRAFLIADSGPLITDYTKLATGPGITGAGGNAAFYFPWIQAPDPLNGNVSRNYPPCGFVAGLYASTDASHGVWKSPAGTSVVLAGATGVAVPLNDAQNGQLDPVAVNCIRNSSVYGTVIWGARTTQGNDDLGSLWKYVPVRRLALFLEESLYRGTQWTVFEPNGEPLWAQIRMNVGSFMQTLFKQGAFQGSSPQHAYFVKCDSETTTSSDQDNGIVNIQVGFAPLKPAEFVVIQIEQMAGQAEA